MNKNNIGILIIAGIIGACVWLVVLTAIVKASIKYLATGGI